MLHRILFIPFLIFFAFNLHAEYIIEGNVNMKGDWQSQIFLATIDKLDDYYSPKAEYIINSAVIGVDGKFSLRGDNLPEYPQFYKLYVVKEAHSEYNAHLFVGGEEHNFIHLILDNQIKVSIESDNTTYAPFGDFNLSGNRENELMKKLSTLLYPSYMFYEVRFPSELQFSRDKLNRDLFSFADTCRNSLVALAAINNTDYDAYLDTYYASYQKVKERLIKEYPSHPYVKNFIRKLSYYAMDPLNSKYDIWKITSCTFGILSIVLLFFYLNLQRKVRLLNGQNVYAKEALTNQEIKIMDLIKDGKSNKEIASHLYIEVSTVKSHINKIYGKLNAKNRADAILKFQQP